jgi:hypothetical protein
MATFIGFSNHVLEKFLQPAKQTIQNKAAKKEIDSIKRDSSKAKIHDVTKS